MNPQRIVNNNFFSGIIVKAKAGDYDEYFAYDTGVFPAEPHHVPLAGCCLLMSYTGAPPAELVDNERKKPNGGPLDEILLMKAITCADGSDADGSDADDKNKFDEADDGVPPDVDSKQLNELLSAETTRAWAFQAPLLRGHCHDDRPPPQDRPAHPGDGQLEASVFRRFRRNGVRSEFEDMLYAKLRDDMGGQSLDAGSRNAGRQGSFEGVRATPRTVRNAPDVIRDWIIRDDPQSVTVYRTYLNDNVGFDIQNTFLEEEAEDQLYGLFAHVSLTRDPRATRDMVPDDGRYKVQSRDGEDEIRELTEQIRTKED
ncbi:hypothetical protein DL768_003910 [Monosporascus sp. mg162]|nr:hypothetical protein DL768_003910 [Monosporascus sp. mg162]